MQENPLSSSWVWSRLQQQFAVTAYRPTQRCFDIIFGLLGIGGLLVIAPVIWLLNLCLAPGPLFYRQERVGLRGRSFQIIKFRSMVVQAEPNGAVWAVKADPRVTPIGRFLRRTHLDELPQCWNILKGEMSVVGPRPERTEFVALLTTALEDYTLRHQVKPGLTGWAQVNYTYGDSVADAERKLQYDLEYIARQSFWFDLLIVLRTSSVVLTGR